MSQARFHVAIAGAGIAGLTLALLLQQNSIPCTVYELRASTASPDGGALMLAPNALRILDQIGLLARIQHLGFNFETIFFKDAAGQTTSEFLMGSTARYGYQAMRIHRHIVVTELRKLAAERGIPVHFEKQISGVVEETPAGVTFQFVDGSTGRATLLVGADGIHSKLRDYVCPGREYAPVYSGQLALSLVTHQQQEDPRRSLPAIFHGRTGALLMLPQSFDGSEVVVGTQLRYPEQDRSGWSALAEDGARLFELWQQGVGEWQSLHPLELERDPAISIWPYYALPNIPSWVSQGKGVVLVGDAAHAIAPTAGQGACQAVEDACTLAVLVASLSSRRVEAMMGKALEFWEKARGERIEKVKTLTLQLGNNRLPQEEREKLPAGHYWNAGEQPDLFWLYGVNVGDEFSRLWMDREATRQ
ncbi:FAD/NAD(P)-binding domain-containing protein [Canariomyces notabilis]|uniref:FAD/NAD(P)-binding domain-containing protein n=1 Tax=Canariomyces notabilis TaxID=2074819 RepID=A0AAN6YSK3_9PEZI|nr:FAD/NAD(P)-binding domain-containing protein [Canariomyces arenarius]